jgi:hypothetical protein
VAQGAARGVVAVAQAGDTGERGADASPQRHGIGAQELGGGAVQDGARVAGAAGVEDGEQFGAEADDERLALGAGAVAGQGLDQTVL